MPYREHSFKWDHIKLSSLLILHRVAWHTMVSFLKIIHSNIKNLILHVTFKLSKGCIVARGTELKVPLKLSNESEENK